MLKASRNDDHNYVIISSKLICSQTVLCCNIFYQASDFQPFQVHYFEGLTTTACLLLYPNFDPKIMPNLHLNH